MDWFHVDCGGLREIDRTYRRSVAGVYRLRCAKCHAPVKVVMCQMPLHPDKTHHDALIYALHLDMTLGT